MKETRRVDMLDGQGFGYVARLTFEPMPDLEYGVRYGWIDWALYRVVATNDDGTVPEFHTPASQRDSGLPSTPDLDQAAPTVSGFCKWDGCAEIDWHERHVCDAGDLGDMLDAVKRVYLECAILTASDALAYCERAGWKLT